MAGGDDHPADLLILDKAKRKADEGMGSMLGTMASSPEQSTAKKGTKRKHSSSNLTTNIADGEIPGIQRDWS